MRIIIALICLAIGYFIGIFLPLNIRPEIEYKPLTSGEYYYYTITTFGVFATFLTVIVALFKDDLIRLIKHTKLNFSFHDNKSLWEDIIDIHGTKKAQKYFSIVTLENQGNLIAENCELFLDRIERQVEGNTEIHLSESKQINWMPNKERIYIPSEGNISFHIFEFLQPQKISTPDGKTNTIPAKFNILGYPDIIAENGKWIFSFTLHSSSINKPLKFIFKVDWNGKWESRLTEMEHNLKVELN